MPQRALTQSTLNMLDINTILSFLVIACLLTIAPGPDILYLITQSLTHGKKAGLALALGLSTGNLFHTLAAAFGISAFIQTSDYAFNGLKIAGVIYLLYLAWGIVQKWQKTNSTPTASVSDGSTHNAFALFKQGVLMNLLNPKVMLFFLALLPQFVDAQRGSIELQMLSLGLLFTAQVVIIFAGISLLAGQLGKRLQNNRHNHWMDWLVLSVYLFLALKLLL